MAMLKDWGFQMMADNFKLSTNCHCEIVCGIKETEKAVYGMFYIGYNNAGHPMRKCGWCPKSAIDNIEALKMIEDYDNAVEFFGTQYATM